jgi:GTPase SAR1 family protein
LVGNKNDLEEERTVTYEEGEKMAQENNITFIEINSKEYVRVEAAFKKITESILVKVESGKLPLNQVILIRYRELVLKLGTNLTPEF